MNITYCPPARVGRDIDFRQRSWHVSTPVEYAGLGEWRSTGLSPYNFGSHGDGEHSRTFQISEHKLFAARRVLVPLWANNDKDLQLVLTAFIVRRASAVSKKVKFYPDKDLKKQIEAAQKRIRSSVPAMLKRLGALSSEYVAAKNSGKPMSELEFLAQQIQALDRMIILAARPAAIVIGIVYYYFHLGYNSPQTAQMLGLSACGVRQIINRLMHVAESLGFSKEFNLNHGYNKMETAQ